MRYRIERVGTPARGGEDAYGLDTGGDDGTARARVFGDRHGAQGLASGPIPNALRGLVMALAEYQRLAADAAWNGTRTDAIRALVANPLVSQLGVAETLFDDMAAAHRDLLPARLLA